jgi:hypothetical protein
MLSDKLNIRRLPLHYPPIAEHVVDLGRIMMPSGELAQIANDVPIRFIAYVEFAGLGIVRANHYHAVRVEWLYILSGRLVGRFFDLDTAESVDHDLEAGDLIMVKPRCAHGYRALEPTQTIEFADAPYDGGDTFPHLLL